MHTEQDLRATLAALADRNTPDVGDLRHRIESRLDEPVLLRGSARRPRSHLITAISVAACVIVTLVIALAVSAGHDRHATPPATHHALVTPAPFGIVQFPGTQELATYHGTGATSIDISGHPLPAGLRYSAAVTCHGTGTVDVAGAFVVDACVRGGPFQTSISGRPQVLHLKVDAATTWQLVLLAEPEPRTNANIESFRDDYFTNADPGLGRLSGQGTGTLRLRSGADFSGYRILVLCAGDGVTLTSSDGKADGDYTHTCFAGFTYFWDVRSKVAPAEVTVHADKKTTWRLQVEAT